MGSLGTSPPREQGELYPNPLPLCEAKRVAFRLSRTVAQGVSGARSI